MLCYKHSVSVVGLVEYLPISGQLNMSFLSRIIPQTTSPQKSLTFSSLILEVCLGQHALYYEAHADVVVVLHFRGGLGIFCRFDSYFQK